MQISFYQNPPVGPVTPAQRATPNLAPMYPHAPINGAPTPLAAQIAVPKPQPPKAAPPPSKTLVYQLFLPPSILDNIVISIS